MNIYTAAGPLPDGDARISFAARLRYNSRCHGAAGMPLGPASIAGIIEETIADEIPFTDEETADVLADLIDLPRAKTRTAQARDTSPAPFAGRTRRSARFACLTVTTRAGGESSP